MKWSRLAVIASLAVSTHSFQQPSIRACVLNHASAPVEQQTISDAMQQVSKEYLQHTGIRLHISEHASYEGHILHAFNRDQETQNPHYACQESHDIALIFTDANISRSNGQLTYRRKGIPLKGIARQSFAVIGSHQNEESYARTVRHEIGHLMQVRYKDSAHSPDQQSIMHPLLIADQSWQREDIKQFRRAANKRNFPAYAASRHPTLPPIKLYTVTED